jgi:hypothetical protein
MALVLGGVGPPEVLLGDRRGTEVGVVEDRPFVAGRSQGRREVGLPDSFGKPRPTRPPAELALELVAHPPQLTDTVPLRKRGQHRLEVAATEDLDLLAGHERA